MTSKARKWLASTVIFICWLPQLYYLIPAPSIEVAEKVHSFAMRSFDKSPEVVEQGLFNRDDYTLDNIYRKAWYQWSFKALVILFGVTSGILMYKNYVTWPFFTVLSSSMYLYIWLFSGSTASVSIIQSYKLKLELAQLHNSQITFIYKDIALPLLFSIVIMSTIYLRLISKRRKEDC